MNYLDKRDIPISEVVDDLLEGEAKLRLDTGDEKFFARPGNQPIALRLREIFQKLGQTIPSEIGLYEMFEVWLVPHRVAIMRQGDNKAEVTSVGIQVEYLNRGATCSVISLIPAPQYINYGRVGVQGLLQGKLNLNGDAFPSSENLQLKPEEHFGKLSVGVLTSGEVGFRFNASVITPLVSAVGVGASNCEWSFVKDDEPLFGRDIETWAILALPKSQMQLTYRLRYYVCWRTCFFSTRRQSKWIDIGCSLT